MRFLFDDREGDRGVPGRRRRTAMLCILVFTAMSMLDMSLVSIALPTIARDLRVSDAYSMWIVSSYQLAGAASILTFSALGATTGFRNVFIGGVLVFTLASFGCALSHSLPALLAFRALQGLGAAAAMCVTSALFRVIFPERLLGSALGINALVVGAGMALGPALGGVIVSAVRWEWLFAINVPLGVVGVYFLWRVLPDEPHRPQRFDIAGALSSACGVGCFFLAMYQLARPGGLQAGMLLLAGAILSALVFLHVERTVKAPLFGLDIFRSERVTLATVTSIVANVGQGMGLVATPFLLQGSYGFSAIVAGLLMTALPFAIMIAAPLAGRLADSYGSAHLATGGLAALALGYGSLAALTPGSASMYAIAASLFVCGFGFGLFQTPNNREFVGVVEPAKLGNASGLLTFARFVGLTLGTVLAAVVALLGAASSSLDNGHASEAHRIALWGAAAFALLATLVSGLRLRRPEVQSS